MSGINVVPNLPKRPVPVIPAIYAELTEVSGTGMEVCTGSGGNRYPYRTELTEVPGTGMGVVPNLPKCPAPVWVSYRTYRSVRYRYRCCTEHTEVSGTGIDAVPNLSSVPGTGIDVVPIIPKRPVPVGKSAPVPAGTYNGLSIGGT